MTELGRVTVGTSISGVFHRFCKSARSAPRQRKKLMEWLHSYDAATFLLIIWVEKCIILVEKNDTFCNEIAIKSISLK